MEEKQYFGVMLDCSRNAMMKIEQLKKFVDTISAFGYNMLQLYTEETYEVKNEPYFGYLRGRYTKEEIRELDAYCMQKGVELVPCIQVLAHVDCIFRWSEYKNINDTEDILLCGEERTYELIENIFSSLAESFSSRLVHIGMDEAHMVGLGKYLEKHGLEDRYQILKKHLDRVLEIAKKYGFKPMMWSDMFFRLGNNGEYYPENPSISEDVANAVPDGVSPVYWDYYHTEKEVYDKMIKAHQSFKGETWFAGGCWCWKGFTPSNRFSLETMKPAILSCREHGVKNVFFTVWGDDGRECSPLTVLPSLFYLSKYYQGETDEEKIKAEFEKITEQNYDDFTLFDELDYVGGNTNGVLNPSKYMLYCDPFYGFFDSTVVGTEAKEYAELSKKIAKAGKRSKKYAYLFNEYACLADVLSMKFDLGVRTRKAYESKDKKAIEELIKEYATLEKKVEKFYRAFEKTWFTENKPNGFEIHDIRFGALKNRLRACKERLQDYLLGNISTIEELEEKILDYTGNDKEYKPGAVNCNQWKFIVTANKLSHPF